MKPRTVGLSIDVDSVASHLGGYGFDAREDAGEAYLLAVPRILDLLDSSGSRSTFFLIAEEALRFPEVVREIRSRGHEVACHSMTHRLPFADLSESRLQLEVFESKRTLEALLGAEVMGFRAPSWDASPDLLLALIGAGYAYDASSYPSILLPFLRRAVARRSARGIQATRSDIWSAALGPARPHKVDLANGSIWEIPITTTPFTRLPYYHTLRMLLPRPAFQMIAAAARLRRGPITYQFHAVDFLGLDEDGLDSRMGRHPGMRRSLQDKLTEAARAVSELKAVGDVVPLLEVAAGRGQARLAAPATGPSADPRR